MSLRSLLILLESASKENVHFPQCGPTISLEWSNLADCISNGPLWGVRAMYVLAFVRRLMGVLLNRHYRPELYYMRGQGPKWREKHRGSSA
jgi:hypothetical protein